MHRLLAMTLGLMIVLQGFACAQEQPKKLKVKVVNAARVYHPRSLTSGRSVEKLKPALLDAKKVFDATPEYKTIKLKGLKKDSAEYKIQERGASTRFKNAIKRVMSLSGYDLIAEKGAATVEGKSLPDITQEVIDNL